MIVKHVPMRSLRKSSFSELGRYLADPQDHRERVGDMRITNCHADELADALLEVTATQARNIRAAGDKTYHLIISFRAGEQPPAKDLAEIEQRICAGLGFGEHQRISAVHHDTDNLHIHVAINKIHPTRLTMHEPFRAYRTLAQLCATLESDFGLERDNHQVRQHGAANRAADMEHAAGMESLLGWIKRECLPQMQQARSWDALNRVLQEHGLELRARGNGLVIQSGDGTVVKASSVSRELSKARLEKRLGAFQEARSVAGRQPSATYSPRPLHTPRFDTTELYARYQAEQRDLQIHGVAARAQARARRDREIGAVKSADRLRRAAIRLMVGSVPVKRLLYAQAHRTCKAEIETIRTGYRKEAQAIAGRHRRLSWRDWLQQQAGQGDAKALAALRANEARQQARGNTVAGTQQRSNQVPGLPPEHVTKKGTLIYRVGSTAIRDDGDCLQVSHSAAPDGLRAVLQMAAQRYGQVLTVHGTGEFKEQVVQAAAASRMGVRFADASLEQRRVALLAAARAGLQPLPRSRSSQR